MGRLLLAENPRTLDFPFTRLLSASSVSATTFTVESNEGYATDDYIVLGEEGNETTELLKISSVSGNNTIISTTSAKFAHSIGDPIRVTPFNQIKFYGNTSTTITDPTHLLATVDIAVDSRDKTTPYHHTSGDNTYYYKYVYYNETTADASSLSEAVTISGGTSNDLYCTEQDILDAIHIGKDDGTAPRTNVILRLIEARTNKINGDTDSSFRTETIANTAYQYVDGRGIGKRYYFLCKAPIISITGLDYTTDLPSETPTWTAMTAGRGNDYLLLDSGKSGMIYITSDTVYPLQYPESLRWYGTWGWATVPDDVKDAVIKGVIYDLSRLTLHRDTIRGIEMKSNSNIIESFNEDWRRVVMRYRNLGITAP